MSRQCSTRPRRRRRIGADTSLRMIGSSAERATWRNTGRWMAALLACGALGWWAFVRGTSVPLLSLVDLGFHELGHLLTYWLPDVVTAMMGSINQVLVPVALAAY